MKSRLHENYKVNISATVHIAEVEKEGIILKCWWEWGQWENRVNGGEREVGGQRKKKNHEYKAVDWKRKKVGNEM